MTSENTNSTNNLPKRTLKFASLLPLIIAFVILVLIIFAIIRIIIWNRGESIDNLPDTSLDLSTETNDYLFFQNPTLLEGNTGYDGSFDVVLIGNDMYLYEKDGKSIADLLEEDLNGKFYNCALKGSRLCAKNDRWDNTFPENNYSLDAFSYFWLSDSIQQQDYSFQWQELEKLPAEIDKAHYSEVLKRLESIDFNTIDLILVCYDGRDFLDGAPGAVPGDPYTIVSMAGAMGASYEKYTINYPFLQQMFVAPTFCYLINEDGSKTGADLPNETAHSLPDCTNYVLSMSMDYSVSYLDNYYGIPINSETADNYLLEDGITPNAEGRRLIANRIVKYINERL